MRCICRVTLCIFMYHSLVLHSPTQSYLSSLLFPFLVALTMFGNGVWRSAAPAQLSVRTRPRSRPAYNTRSGPVTSSFPTKSRADHTKQPCLCRSTMQEGPGKDQVADYEPASHTAHTPHTTMSAPAHAVTDDDTYVYALFDQSDFDQSSQKPPPS